MYDVIVPFLWQIQLWRAMQQGGSMHRQPKTEGESCGNSSLDVKPGAMSMATFSEVVAEINQVKRACEQLSSSTSLVPFLN